MMDEKGDVSFQEAINFLFDNCLRADGKPYTDRDLAKGLTDAGVKVSHAYIWLLRQGKKDDPRRSHILALARFFGVPSGFFLDRDVHVEWRERLSDGAPAELPAQRKAQSALLRSFPGMSDRSKSLIEALAAHVSELEGDDPAEAAHG